MRNKNVFSNLLKDFGKGEPIYATGNHRYNELKSNRNKYIKVSEFIKK